MGASSPGDPEVKEGQSTMEETTKCSGEGNPESTNLLMIANDSNNVEDEIDALPANLKYTCYDLLCTLVSMLTYVFDFAMDCTVAFYFYHLAVNHGIYHYWYFGLTVAFIVLPSLTMTGFSLRWYLMDADNPHLPEVSWISWIIRLLALMFQFAPILRYADSIRYGLLSRKAAAEEERVKDDSIARKRAADRKKKYFTLMVYEDADATLLRLFESFMESAPQLVLQIYILIKDPHATGMRQTHLIAGDEVADSLLKSTILVASVISSLISLAWSLVVYHRSLRYTYPEKNNLDWRGSVFQFMWHFSSITARVIALSLFATVKAEGIGLVCGVHWILMSIWVIFQRTQACNTKCEEFLFSLVLGAIYIFSFFNAKEERTRYKYMIYYGFCFCENTCLIVIWIVYGSGFHHWYFYPAILGHYFAFFMGLMFMTVYYYFFHPSNIQKVKFSLGKKRHKPFMMRHKKEGTSVFFKSLRRISNFSNRRTVDGDGISEGAEMKQMCTHSTISNHQNQTSPDDQNAKNATAKNRGQQQMPDDLQDHVKKSDASAKSMKDSYLTTVEIKLIRPSELQVDTLHSECKLSPSISSPILDSIDSPDKCQTDRLNFIRSSSIPANVPRSKQLHIFHARSFKSMGSRRNLPNIVTGEKDSVLTNLL